VGGAGLRARSEAVLRRTRTARAEAPAEPRLEIGPLSLDPGLREALLGGEPVQRTRKEFDLLALLAARAPEVVARDAILDQVWGASWESSSRTLDTHIASLRGKLRDPVRIRTVRGVGYRLSADAEPA